VTVVEILKMVNSALGAAQVDDCRAGDAHGKGQITTAEILIAVNHALRGACD
jgi:hypothetical protein